MIQGIRSRCDGDVNEDRNYQCGASDAMSEDELGSM